MKIWANRYFPGKQIPDLTQKAVEKFLNKHISMEEIFFKLKIYKELPVRKCHGKKCTAGFRKGRGTRDQIADVRWITKKQGNSRKTSTSDFYTLVAQMVKSPPAMQETWVHSLSREDPLEEGMAAHSSIPVWRTPWTEEPGGLQSTGLQKVGHD